MQDVLKAQLQINGKTVAVKLSGEIDHHSVQTVRQRIDDAILGREPDNLLIDFGGVSFMDSSGIGLVMGRYKLIENTDCKLFVTGLSARAYTVMKLSGLEKIAVLKRRNEKDENAQ
ncbi:MAG: STAS domain-containing protein [Ruminococcaceae bacterium]|nr:STAS domain-containing protein [Oscillospiraceae bacterium]